MKGQACTGFRSAPVGGTFSLTNEMVNARAFHAAQRFDNAKVLVAGGEGLNGFAEGGAELYDPAAHQFSTTGSMFTARIGAAAVLVSSPLTPPPPPR
jgi:Galactose oxidase, central domain